MSNSKLWMFTVFIIVFSIVAYLLGPVIWQFVIGGIFAYILTPLVTFVEKHLKLKHGLSILVVLFFIFIVFALLFSFLVPAIVTQISLLINDLPTYTDKLLAWLEDIKIILSKSPLPASFIDNMMSSIQQSDGALGMVLKGVMDTLVAIPGKAIEAIIGFIILLYFLIDGKKIITGFVNLFSRKNQHIVSKILTEVNYMIWGYFRTNAILALGISTATFIGLSLFGVKYAPLVAILAFVFDFIPYFGSLFTAFVSISVAFFTIGWPGALYVAIYMIVVQQLEVSVFGPRLQAHSIGIHPLWIMFSLLSCGLVWGPIGMFVAVPVAGIIKVTFRELHSKFMSME